MVTNNKVLTVSYGTFSCTLEGFDDSFGAMKAIAEYFRDLAADDRYFGAEPPTPDAEMLTRIAEREIERRVQARHESGAIVLSAAPSMAEEETSEEQTPEQEQTEAADEVAEAEVEATDKDEATDIQEDAELEETPSEEMVAEDAAEAPAEVEDQPVYDVVEASEEDRSDEQEVTAQDIVEEPAVAEAAEAFFATSESDANEATFEQEDDEEDTVNLFEDAFAEAEDEEPAEEDSIAAKLRRIRAVVSRAETVDEDDEDYIEDQHADVTDPIDLDLNEEEPEAEAQIEAEAELTSDEAEEEVQDEIEAVQEAPKPRARVIRMKRAEFEDAVSEGVLEEAEEEDAEADPETSLSDEDEADLMAELAQVDAELAEADEDFAEPAPQIEEPVDVAPATDDDSAKREKRLERRAKLDAVEPGEEAVDRLIEEANTKLDEPEGNRRRSAIAHLRAAVAATKAEKAAGKSFDKEDNSEAYRDDLAEAVRPRQSRRDAKSAPPLKLVAEQRIDAPAQEKVAGIRPRRVSVDDLAAAEANEASSNFVEFAENMGATQLPDVLEAAASYLTFVEGRKKFSRPMLMRLAYQVGDKRFEREAGLRSFGQLLRDKKIEKIAGGRFTVSDAINFKPDDRAAG